MEESVSTEINGETTSMVWPILESRTAKERNRTVFGGVEEFLSRLRSQTFLLETRVLAASPWGAMGKTVFWP